MKKKKRKERNRHFPAVDLITKSGIFHRNRRLSPFFLFLFSIFFQFRDEDPHYKGWIGPIYRTDLMTIKTENASSNVLLQSKKRLMRDLKEIQQNPLENIAASPLEDNLFVWHVNSKQSLRSLC